MSPVESLHPALPVFPGIEDKFRYHISDECVMCGSCQDVCPVNAIYPDETQYRIDPRRCIDCGTCSTVCPVGAAARLPLLRESISLQEIDWEHAYFNPGCALSLYKPDAARGLFALLKQIAPTIQYHEICCRHDPQLEAGSVIINNCAGCDRRFRSLYRGIQTISCWELLDSVPDLDLPDHSGLKVSVHDSCGYRHKPQVHRAVRGLLRKMNIEIEEAEFSGTESVCCGDNFYGHVPNNAVEQRIRERADQFPCEDVVVYCIGCVRAMEFGGKTPRYLPDLILGRETETMPDTLDEYHGKLSDYIQRH